MACVLGSKQLKYWFPNKKKMQQFKGLNPV